MSRTGTPRIALHLGDTTGIGPELCARVLGEGRLADEARIVVVGDLRVLERGMREAGVVLRGQARAVGRGSRLEPAGDPDRSISATSIRKRCRAARYRRNPDG